MMGRAEIEQVEGGWIVETQSIGSPSNYKRVYTDFVEAISAVASAVGYMSEIRITPPPSASGEPK